MVRRILTRTYLTLPYRTDRSLGAGNRLRIQRLKAGKYRDHARSAAFPMLPPAVVDRFLRLVETTDETAVVRAFRAWVRRELLGPARRPRRRKSS